MSDREEYHYPNSVKSLEVVSPDGGARVASSPGSPAEGGSSEPSKTPNLNAQSIIDRAIDPNISQQQKSLKEKVIDALKMVYDPEIPVDIYELGLIYDIQINSENHVDVKMTLTAPGCPVAGSLPGEVQARVQQIPEVKSADVELVWEPPWDKSRMSESALLELGLM